MITSPRARTRARAGLAALAVVALGALGACGSDSDVGTTATTTGSGSISVTDVWSRTTAASATNGAVYFTITNEGSTDDELTGASVPTDIAGEAQIHETVQAQGDSDGSGGMTGSTMGGMSGSTMADGSAETTMPGSGMLSMQQVQAVAVPAGATVTFAPGGYHVMLLGLVQPLEEGTSFPVTLTFAEAGEIQVTAQVRAS
jgi:copper(I)-binding protein